MPSGLPSNLLSNIQHHLNDIQHHLTDLHHTITNVILYLEIPSWKEYSQSLSETYQHTLAATKSTYKLWILTFRPFLILLGLLAGCTIQLLEFIGHYTLIVLKFVGRHTVHHGYLSLKAGYQQVKTASIWFVGFQRSLSPAAIGAEVGVLCGIGLLWWMRRYIKRKRYVERVGRWYGSKKRMVLRRYNNAIHQISQTSLFLAMLLPHVLYLCFVTTIKYFVPKVVTYIATQTYTSGFVSVLWPLGKTVLLVHRYRGVKIKVDEKRRREEEEEERKRREQEKEKSSKNGGDNGGAGTTGMSWASSMAGSLFGSGGGGNDKKAEEQKSKNNSSALSPQKVGTKMGAAASATSSSSSSAKKTATGGAPTAKQQSKLAQRYLRATAATETENNLSSAPSSLKAGGPLVSKGMKKKIDTGKNNSNNGTTDSNTKKEDDSSNSTEYPEEALLSLDEELVQIQEEAIELLRYWTVYVLLCGIFHFVYLLPVVGRIVSNAGRVPTIDPPKFMKTGVENKGYLSGFTLALSYQFLEEMRLAFFVWLCLLPTSLTVPGTGGSGGGGGVVDSTGGGGGGVKARTAAFEKAAAAVVGVKKFKKKALPKSKKSLMATYQNRPIDILYNRLTPLAISMVQSSNSAVTVAQQRASSSAAASNNGNDNNNDNNTGGNVLGKITSTLTSFLDLAVLVRLISKETKQKIVTIVMESSSLLPSAITLVMPSYFTQYGILYANAMVPSANSSLVVNELQKKTNHQDNNDKDNINDDDYYALLGGMMRYLQYWTLHTLLSYILTSFSSLLSWIPFSTHITLLLWMFVLLERTTLSWYGILEAELIAFGVLHPHEGTEDGGGGGGGMDLEKTVTVRLLKRLGSSLPTGVVVEGGGKEKGEEQEEEEGSLKKDGLEVVGSENEKGGAIEVVGVDKRLSVVAEQAGGGGEGKEGKLNDDDMDDGGRTDGPISEKKSTAAAKDGDNGQNSEGEEKKMTNKASIQADDDTMILTSEATPSTAVGESSNDDDAKKGEHLAIKGRQPLLKSEEEETMTKKAPSVQDDVPKIPASEASSSMGVVENYDDASAGNSTNEVVTSGRERTSADGDTAPTANERG